MGKATALHVHAVLAAHGGSEAVGAWTIEALRDAYDVTVLTWRAPDLRAINDRYGTSLQAGDVRWIYPSPAARRAIDLIPDNTWNWQKRSWLMRVCKRIQQNYEVLIASDSEFDFGRPGVQYVHYPWMGPSYREVQAFGSLAGWRVVPALARRVYRPWMKTADFHFEAMIRNVTLANSDWTAEECRRYYGRDAYTVYPPAAGQFVRTDWGQRRDEFVAISRLEIDKNHNRIIRILKAVREDFPQIRLHIVGTRLRNAKGERDYRKLRTLVDPEGDWITLREDLPRSAMMRLLGEIRYGIHLFEKEHFGIAVAEMTRGGLIPFVHDSGGQVEIVQHPALRFRNDEEAILRIKTMLGDVGLREQVRAGLRISADRFTPERFCAEILRWTERGRSSTVGQADH